MKKTKVIQIEADTYELLFELSRLIFRGQRGASTKNRRIRKKYIQRALDITVREFLDSDQIKDIFNVG